MKLLIVDDHPMIRQGVSALLAQMEPDAVVLQAAGADEALVVADAHADLDAILLDLALPGAGGLSALREFGRRWPQLPVLVLSASEETQHVRQALAAGALGYVPKSASPHTLLAALQLVLSGEIYVPPLLLARAQTQDDPAAPALTPRQTEVLEGLSRGASNAAIGRSLGMSEKTVKTHVTAILRSLHAKDRTQAVAQAARAGLI